MLITRESSRGTPTYSLKVYRCVPKIGAYANAFYQHIPERMLCQPHRWQLRGDFALSIPRRPVCNLFRKSLWRPQSSVKREKETATSLTVGCPPPPVLGCYAIIIIVSPGQFPDGGGISSVKVSVEKVKG